MRGYGQYCSVARGAEILAERWTLIIVRNLLLGCRTYSEIAAGAPGIPHALLTQRLRSLERQGIVARGPGRTAALAGYQLTAAGAELEPVCIALGTWATRWLDFAPEHLDPFMVFWSMCRLGPTKALPTRAVVARFDLVDVPNKHFWLRLQRPTAELRLSADGQTADIVVTTDTEWLVKWHMGWISLEDAMRRGLAAVTGPQRLREVLAVWGVNSRFGKIRPVRRTTLQSGRGGWRQALPTASRAAALGG